jgi:hypothetical protein
MEIQAGKGLPLERRRSGAARVVMAARTWGRRRWEGAAAKRG